MTADILSAECTVARRPEYSHFHETCRQARDIHMPHSDRVVLVPRCRCACHRTSGEGQGVE